MLKAGRKRRRIVYDEVTFSEHEGVRYLHFGTEWVQGAMALHRPNELVLEYAQQMMAWMLFIEAPQAIMQLGLGAASLTKFCYHNFPVASQRVVELNPAVIAAARTMFRLPQDSERLWVVEADAMTEVEAESNHERFDVLQVDLYDATARGPVLDSIDFYAACRRCLKAPGMLSVNLFGEHASFGRNVGTLGAAFDGRVVVLPPVNLGNRIALAFNGPEFDVPVAQLYERAAQIDASTRLPAKSWVDGLKAVAQERIALGRFSR